MMYPNSIGAKQNKRRYESSPLKLIEAVNYAAQDATATAMMAKLAENRISYDMYGDTVGEERRQQKNSLFGWLYGAGPLTLGRSWHQALAEEILMSHPFERYEALRTQIMNITELTDTYAAMQLIRSIYNLLREGMAQDRIIHLLIQSGQFAHDAVDEDIAQQLGMTLTQYEIWIVALLVDLVLEYRTDQLARAARKLTPDDSAPNQAQVDGPLSKQPNGSPWLVGTETGRISSSRPNMEEIRKAGPGTLMPPANRPATQITMDDLYRMWEESNTARVILEKALASIKHESDPAHENYHICLLNVHSAAIGYVSASERLIKFADQIHGPNGNPAMPQGAVNATPR